MITGLARLCGVEYGSSLSWALAPHQDLLFLTSSPRLGAGCGRHAGPRGCYVRRGGAHCPRSEAPGGGAALHSGGVCPRAWAHHPRRQPAPPDRCW